MDISNKKFDNLRSIEERNLEDDNDEETDPIILAELA